MRVGVLGGGIGKLGHCTKQELSKLLISLNRAQCSGTSSTHHEVPYGSDPPLHRPDSRKDGGYEGGGQSRKPG